MADACVVLFSGSMRARRMAGSAPLLLDLCLRAPRLACRKQSRACRQLLVTSAGDHQVRAQGLRQHVARPGPAIARTCRHVALLGVWLPLRPRPRAITVAPQGDCRPLELERDAKCLRRMPVGNPVRERSLLPHCPEPVPAKGCCSNVHAFLERQYSAEHVLARDSK